MIAKINAEFDAALQPASGWLSGSAAPLQGIDFSAAGVRHARQRARSLAADARFGIGALDATGLADGFADAAMSVDALHFAPDPARPGASYCA